MKMSRSSVLMFLIFVIFSLIIGYFYLTVPIDVFLRIIDFIFFINVVVVLSYILTIAIYGNSKY
jgi:predicted membrane protein